MAFFNEVKALSCLVSVFVSFFEPKRKSFIIAYFIPSLVSISTEFLGLKSKNGFNFIFSVLSLTSLISFIVISKLFITFLLPKKFLFYPNQLFQQNKISV